MSCCQFWNKFDFCNAQNISKAMPHLKMTIGAKKRPPKATTTLLTRPATIWKQCYQINMLSKTNHSTLIFPLYQTILLHNFSKIMWHIESLSGLLLYILETREYCDIIKVHHKSAITKCVHDFVLLYFDDVTLILSIEKLGEFAIKAQLIANS